MGSFSRFLQGPNTNEFLPPLHAHGLCRWCLLKVVFDDDGSDVVWEEFDLCKLDKITLRYNRSSGEVRADVE